MTRKGMSPQAKRGGLLPLQSLRAKRSGLILKTRLLRRAFALLAMTDYRRLPRSLRSLAMTTFSCHSEPASLYFRGAESFIWKGQKPLSNFPQKDKEGILTGFFEPLRMTEKKRHAECLLWSISNVVFLCHREPSTFGSVTISTFTLENFLKRTWTNLKRNRSI